MNNLSILLPNKADLIDSKYNVEILGNEILYKICENHPTHTMPEAVCAKLWIIGRSYAAALERNRAGAEAKAIYMDTVKELINEGTKLDSMIYRLRPIIDDTTMSETLSVHKMLLEIFRRTTQLEKRSLASKYLHFHRRDVFYIFDANAYKSLPNFVKGSIKSDRQYDSEYYRFCVRAFALKERIKENYSEDLTPRELDNLLIYLSP